MHQSRNKSSEGAVTEDAEIYFVVKELVKFTQYLNFVTNRT